MQELLLYYYIIFTVRYLMRSLLFYTLNIQLTFCVCVHCIYDTVEQLIQMTWKLNRINHDREGGGYMANKLIDYVTSLL